MAFFFAKKISHFAASILKQVYMHSPFTPQSDNKSQNSVASGVAVSPIFVSSRMEIRIDKEFCEFPIHFPSVGFEINKSMLGKAESPAPRDCLADQPVHLLCSTARLSYSHWKEHGNLQVADSQKNILDT